MTLFLIIVALLLLLIFIGVPIGFSLGLLGLFSALMIGDINLVVITQRLFTGVDSFPLMAIPFFMLAGRIMSTGSISKVLVDFAYALVGGIKGGLNIVAILGSMFFAALSGSAVATASAIGGILLPPMKEKGYDEDVSAALVASASVIGPVIPPSIPMIVYGVVSGASIGALFMAGIIPGILLGIALMIPAYIIAKKRNYPSENTPRSKRGLGKSFIKAFPALLMPVIVLGGIYGGIFTPTEAAVIACAYGILIEAVYYRSLRLKDLPQLFGRSALDASLILFVIATASGFSWVLTSAQIPHLVAKTVLGISSNPIVLLLLVNLILLVTGCIMDTNVAVLVLTPILVPILLQAGVDLVHIGIIIVVNLCIGLITPPVGMCLYVASNVSKVPVNIIIKSTVPFLVMELIVLFLVTYVPPLSMFLPSILR